MNRHNGAQPIAQVHNGIKYRSRTEARWAAYFQNCGVDFEYEPEGYELAGEWYVPDFLLPFSGTYFEVKGREPNLRERRVAAALSSSLEAIVVIAIGNPNSDAKIIGLRPGLKWEDLQLSSDNSSSGVWLGMPQVGHDEIWSVPLTANCTSRGSGSDYRLDEAGKIQFRAPEISGQDPHDWKNRERARLTGEVRYARPIARHLPKGIVR